MTEEKKKISWHLYPTMYEKALLSSIKGEASPSIKMQIGRMKYDFRNLTAKVWANLGNPIKRYDFSKVSLILCMSPSQVALF